MEIEMSERESMPYDVVIRHGDMTADKRMWMDDTPASELCSILDDGIRSHGNVLPELRTRMNTSGGMDGG